MVNIHPFEHGDEVTVFNEFPEWFGNVAWIFADQDLVAVWVSEKHAGFLCKGRQVKAAPSWGSVDL